MYIVKRMIKSFGETGKMKKIMKKETNRFLPTTKVTGSPRFISDESSK